MKHAKDDDGQNPCPVRGVSHPKRKMSCLINTFLTTVHLEDNSWWKRRGSMCEDWKHLDQGIQAATNVHKLMKNETLQAKHRN